MIDSYFRKKLPQFLTPLAHLLIRYKISPNGLTLSAFLVALVSAYAVTQSNFLTAIALWWTSRLLDALDGLVARETKSSSAFGAYLDISLDMAAYSAMVVALHFSFPHFSNLWVLVLFLYVLCICTALAYGIGEEKLGITSQDNRGIRLGAGLTEGGETGLYYTLCLLFPFLIKSFTLIWIVLLFSTLIFRSILAFKKLKD